MSKNAKVNKIGTGHDNKVEGLHGNTMAAKIFNFIFRFRDSRLFIWISNNYTFSLVLVAVGGFIIIGLFIWFIFYNIIQNNPQGTIF